MYKASFEKLGARLQAFNNFNYPVRHLYNTAYLQVSRWKIAKFCDSLRASFKLVNEKLMHNFLTAVVAAALRPLHTAEMNLNFLIIRYDNAPDMSPAGPQALLAACEAPPWSKGTMHCSFSMRTFLTSILFTFQIPSGCEQSAPDILE